MLERLGALLLERLREALCPGVLASPDDAALAPPGGARKDFRLGVFLYDIRNSSPFGAAPPVRISATERRLPPKTVDLCYLLFANRAVPFDGMQAEDEALLLEAALRAVHDGVRLPCGVDELTVRFESLTLAEKAALWQALGSPMQPAVYVCAAPVSIPSGRVLRAPAVREISYHMDKKEEAP